MRMRAICFKNYCAHKNCRGGIIEGVCNPKHSTQLAYYLAKLGLHGVNFYSGIKHSMKHDQTFQDAAEPTASKRPFTGLIIREKEPENLEFPFSALNSAVTPTEQLFVRSHFPVPPTDLKTWRL